jgi:xanthine dehydrogenase accessory factor
MAVSAGGEVSGSVSGGCVESAVVEAALDVLSSGAARMLHFGVADEAAWEVGLSCGGKLEVFVEPLAPDVYPALRAALVAGEAVATVTVVAGPAREIGRKLVLLDGKRSGSLGVGARDETAEAAAAAALEEARGRRVDLGPASAPQETVGFVDVLPPPPTLVMVGGVHIAIALAAVARTLGYRTVVVDPRPVFGSEARFPGVDRLVHEWPDEALSRMTLDASTAVAVLTHDPKLDDPALRAALPSRAFYVGALGSRATQARRRQRLLAAGVGEEPLRRLHAPIGLDLGGRTPEEIALAVMAQVVAARNRSALGQPSGAPSAAS